MLGGVVYPETIQKNQVVVRHEHGSAFYSYNTFIGAKIGSKLYLTHYHDHSKTTNKYCGQWCGYGVADRRRMLQDGRAVMVE